MVSRETRRTIAIVIALVLCYLFLHAYRYQHCIFQPGIFAWPDVCF
jgi:hypothetical protein